MMKINLVNPDMHSIPFYESDYSKFPTEESNKKPRSTKGGSYMTIHVIFFLSSLTSIMLKLTIRWRLIILDGFLLFEVCELHGIALESLTYEVQVGDI